MNDSIVTASSGKDHPNCYNFLEILQLNKPDSISYKEVQSTGAVLHGKLICVNIVIWGVSFHISKRKLELPRDF